MSYKYERRHSPNYGYPDRKKGTNNPKYIVIHHWGSDKATYNGTVDWLCNGTRDYPTSAHYVVEAGRVAKLLSLHDAAWHTGDREANESSIGIECRPRCSADDMKTVAELIANIWVKYENEFPELKSHKIKGHKDIVATSCPGRWYNKLGELKKMAEKIYKKKMNPRKPNSINVPLYDVKIGDRTNSSRRCKMLLRARNYLPDSTDCSPGTVFRTEDMEALNRFQEKNKIPVVKVCDSRTWKELICG